MSKDDIKKLPQIIIKNTMLKNDSLKSSLSTLMYKDDVIYESRDGDFLNERVIIVNRLDLTTNSSRTVAYESRGGEIVKSSDSIVKIIGQKNYDVLFSALCSVISQELKVRGILSLLTNVKHEKIEKEEAIKKVEKSCQTNETSIDVIIKPVQKKRTRRPQFYPYVVKDKPTEVKKIVIDPKEFEYFDKQKETESPVESDTRGSTLPTIDFIDEDSNASIGNLSSLSIGTLPSLLENPNALLNYPELLVNDIEKCTANDNTNYQVTMLTLLDGTQIQIPIKPEDDFHIATTEILNHVAPDLRCKLLLYQAYLDWKFCMQRDEDGCLPIHNAVQLGDVDMVRRHCLVLRMRNEPVDIMAGNNWTALQMSLHQSEVQITSILLEFGADPLITDNEDRTCIHRAAEETPEHLRSIINYCRANPMRILRENEEFWRSDIETKSKEEQAQYLLDKLCHITDNQGYTPLMLASKIGNQANVRTLLEAAPTHVNNVMPNTGNTALYLAVGAACMDATNRGNMTKVPVNFLSTIEVLIEFGAEPGIDNHSGSNVNTLLTEYNISELSLLIANKMTMSNVSKNKMANSETTFENLMLVKDDEGNINTAELKKEWKPKIVEQVIISPPNTKTNEIIEPKYINTFKTFIKNPIKPEKTENVIDKHKNKLIILKKPVKNTGKEIGRKKINLKNMIIIKNSDGTVPKIAGNADSMTNKTCTPRKICITGNKVDMTANKIIVTANNSDMSANNSDMSANKIIMSSSEFDRFTANKCTTVSKIDLKDTKKTISMSANTINRSKVSKVVPSTSKLDISSSSSSSSLKRSSTDNVTSGIVKFRKL